MRGPIVHFECLAQHNALVIFAAWCNVSRVQRSERWRSFASCQQISGDSVVELIKINQPDLSLNFLTEAPPICCRSVRFTSTLLYKYPAENLMPVKTEVQICRANCVQCESSTGENDYKVAYFPTVLLHSYKLEWYLSMHAFFSAAFRWCK